MKDLPFDGDRIPLEVGVENGIKWALYQWRDWVNGYVQLPEGHKLLDVGGYRIYEIDADIHGGITYDEDGWVGFDTTHGGDVWPSKEPVFVDKWTKLWNVDLVREEVLKLVKFVDESRVPTPKEIRIKELKAELEQLGEYL